MSKLTDSNTTIKEKYRDINKHRDQVKMAYSWLKKAKLPSLIISEDTDKVIMHSIRHHDEDVRSSAGQDIKNDIEYLWHLHKNNHHWQYWMLIDDEDGIILLDMPFNCIVEMICDWMAPYMGNGKIREFLEWYDEHRNYMSLSQNTRKIINSIIGDIRRFLDE